MLPFTLVGHAMQGMTCNDGVFKMDIQNNGNTKPQQPVDHTT